MRSGLGLIALIASASTGCSFFFVERARPGTERAPMVDCSASYAAPVVDTLLFAAMGAGAIRDFRASDADYQNAIPRPAALAIDIGLLAFFAASAHSGYGRVGECRDILAGHVPFVERPPQATQQEKADEQAEEAAVEAAAQARAQQIAAEQAKAAGEAARQSSEQKHAPQNGKQP